MSAIETLLFVSPRFPFPVDSGGKIRTTQILRGLKGGRFKVRLASAVDRHAAGRYGAELKEVCDEFVSWPAVSAGRWKSAARFRHLPGKVPVPVATDYSAEGAAVIERELRLEPNVAVFDFVHAAILSPAEISVPSVMFTHNVEAEIFERHARVSRNSLKRMLWSNQYRKMRAFEGAALSRFDVVVAVSERDAKKFVAEYGTLEPFVIPTGVDLDYFPFEEPIRGRDVVFCGSMDWLANQDAIQYFLEKVWPLIVEQIPDARMTVVGRAPPAALVSAAKRRGYSWAFTGYVDDVRPYVWGAAVSVIPLRIGGGTRLKIFESMAMGPAVVSTSIGVEGLPVESGRHCVVADDAAGLAAAAVELMRDARLRLEMSRAARGYVEAHCGYRMAAKAFEEACALAIARRAARSAG